MVVALVLVCTACRPASESPTTQDAADIGAVSSTTLQRWYESSQVDQVDRGEQVYMEHCAACHGDEARGLVSNWRQRLDDGSFPPPPLNGSAHTWHHPLQQLLQTIEVGGIPYGGQMPGFGDTIVESDRLAVIAYFQSFWSDDIYMAWLQMGGLE